MSILITGAAGFIGSNHVRGRDSLNRAPKAP
jgi:dTDP-D-glucose 4,6-dehydratase